MEIECRFREFGPYGPAMAIEGERKKLGRYEGGSVPSAKYGDRKWSIAATIELPRSISEYAKEGMSEEDVVQACVNFLNKKPKRARKFPYGSLACRFFVARDKEISVSLLTNDRNNKHFWGRGKKNMGQPSKRGRPRKNK